MLQRKDYGDNDCGRKEFYWGSNWAKAVVIFFSVCDAILYRYGEFSIGGR